MIEKICISIKGFSPTTGITIGCSIVYVTKKMSDEHKSNEILTNFQNENMKKECFSQLMKKRIETNHHKISVERDL